MSMNVNSISSQPLKPSVNFKAEEMTETVTDKKPMSTGEKVGWSVGGAAALAGITLGIIKLLKGKGASKEDASIIQGRVLETVEFKKINDFILEGVNKAGNKIRILTKNGKKVIVEIDKNTNKAVKTTKITADGAITTEFLKDGKAITNRTPNGSSIRTFIDKEGMKTTTSKAPDGFTLIQLSKENNLIGSVSHKDGKIVSVTGNITAEVKDGKLVYEIKK